MAQVARASQEVRQAVARAAWVCRVTAAMPADSWWILLIYSCPERGWQEYPIPQHPERLKHLALQVIEQGRPVAFCPFPGSPAS